MGQLKRYSPTLTSLRWIAATMVFLRHVTILPAGATGVSFFFILSGFVLSWTNPTGQSARTYYAKRVARIYPAYGILTVAAIPLLVAVDRASVPAGVLRGLFTLTLLQSWIPSQLWYYAGLSVAWSLSTEAFFYLVFPFISRRLEVLKSVSRHLVWVLVVCAALAIAIPIAVHPTGEDGLAYWFIYVFPPVRLLEFVVGMCLGMLYRDGKLPCINFRAALALSVLAVAVAEVAPVWAMWVAITIVPFSLLIVASAQRDAVAVKRPWLAHPRLVVLGFWSYAFYLIHTMVVYAYNGVVERTGFDGPLALKVVVTYGVATACAAATYKLIERPAESRLRERWLPKVAA